MTEPVVITDVRGRVGLIRINRPRERNALNIQVMTLTCEAAEAFDARADIGAIVLTGDDTAFAAGADIAVMAGASRQDMLTNGMIELWQRLKSVRKPIIAAVSGWCLGGGHELAMLCDMIVASESARFGQPEVNLGVIPGAGGTQRLARAVGKTLAMEMVLDGRLLDAKEALAAGLINQVAPVERYLANALALAERIATRAPLAVQAGKAAVNLAFETPLAAGLNDERQMFYALFDTADQKEGMRAFLEKRPPQWTGK